MTITIELPEELAARAEAAGLKPDQMGRFAVAGIAGAIDAITKTVLADTEENDTPSPEVLADLSAAAKAMEEDRKTGRLLTLEQVDAELEAAFAARRMGAVRTSS